MFRRRKQCCGSALPSPLFIRRLQILIWSLFVYVYIRTSAALGIVQTSLSSALVCTSFPRSFSSFATNNNSRSYSAVFRRLLLLWFFIARVIRRQRRNPAPLKIEWDTERVKGHCARMFERSAGIYFFKYPCEASSAAPREPLEVSSGKRAFDRMEPVGMSKECSRLFFLVCRVFWVLFSKKVH